MNRRLSGRAWRGLFTLLLTGTATFATASAASGAGTVAGARDGAAFALSAQRGTPAECQDASAVCIPDGNYTITVGNTNPAACRFDVTIVWGDGSTEKVVLGPSRDVSHSYTSPGVYTITASGVGTALEPGATCTGGSATIKVEVPVGGGAELPPDVLELLGGIGGLVGDFDKHLKRFRKANHNKPSKKLEKRVDAIVRDGRLAKGLKRDFRELGLPKEGDIAFPCPASTRASKACPGEVTEKLEDLWGFLKSLTELADYPKYQRKRADEWYKHPEGRRTLDKLAWLNDYAKGRTPEAGDYARLTEKQKNDIASQAQVYNGAINKALRDAQKAGKAGAEVVY